MSMNNPTRRVVQWVGLVVAVLVIAVGLIALLVLNRQSDGRSSTEATPSATPAPTSSSTVPHDEADLPEVIVDNPYDCKLQMDAEELESFTQRFLAYEAIRVANSEQKVELITPFATEDFLRTQTDVGQTAVANVSMTLDNPSPFGCYMDDPTQIVAYINPLVTIVDLATGQVQSRNQLLMTHYTQWIKVGGQWYVNQERF